MTKAGRKWPTYLLGGRVRTSTVALILAFCLMWWLYQEYKPAPEPVQAPATEVVPPGFVPDPAYTWVPRTNVQAPRGTTATTTTSTSPTSTETSSPTSTTSPTSTSETSTTSPTSTAPPALLPGAPTTAVPGPGPSPSPSR